MFVRARIEEGVDDNALLVPQVAVTHDPQGQATTLVVGPDSKVAQRTIQATRTFDTNWVVDSGLDAGEKVIVSGVQRAPPGVLVHAVDVQAEPSSNAATSQAPSPPQQPPAPGQQPSAHQKQPSDRSRALAQGEAQSAVR